MDGLIVFTAQYLLWFMVAGFGLIWLFAEDRNGKVELAARAVVGIVIMVIFMYIAKTVHHDPRPFVQNPHIHPLFAHSRDDGFPSDHSLAAGLMAVLILFRHRWLGIPFVAAGVVIAWARVAAHVHHLQDVAAGLLLGGLAAVLAYFVVVALDAPLRRRGLLTDSGSRAEGQRSAAVTPPPRG